MGLRAFVLRWRARLSSRRAGVVLVYHRVGGLHSGDADAEILPTVGRPVFERQLRDLRRHYRMVSAGELLAAVRSRRRGERFPVAVTFDDDLPEHVREALPALRATGLTATFFLSGASLEEPHAFWWEDLQRAVDEELVTAADVPHVDAAQALARSPRAILELSGAVTRLPAEQRSDVAVALRAAVGPPRRDQGLRRADVRRLTDEGCTVGFHTLRHEVLPSLSDAELHRALREGREPLMTASGRPVEAIAYPYGKADERVAAAARAAGFAAGFTTLRGVVTPDADPLLLPRTVPDLSASGLALRLARLFAAA
jgi:peptidoglycan/xylan/chitin deacetylase (PgdA/CDA1 family)